MLGGNLIDNRRGLVNYSLIGRGVDDKSIRDKFVKLDKELKLREIYTKMLQEDFPKLSIIAAGQTGIDITYKNWKKDFVKTHLKNKEIIFFGDQLDKEGNDYPMTKIAKCFSVIGPKDLIKQLKERIK